jgi:putative FmdB family regulatory protein
MGLFEYKCPKCGEPFKIWKHVQPADGEHNCKKCHTAGEPVWAASVLQFKGDGWYVNDYKKKTAETTEVGFAPESDD